MGDFERQVQEQRAQLRAESQEADRERAAKRAEIEARLASVLRVAPIIATGLDASDLALILQEMEETRYPRRLFGLVRGHPYIERTTRPTEYRCWHLFTYVSRGTGYKDTTITTYSSRMLTQKGEILGYQSTFEGGEVVAAGDTPHVLTPEYAKSLKGSTKLPRFGDLYPVERVLVRLAVEHDIDVT